MSRIHKQFKKSFSIMLSLLLVLLLLMPAAGAVTVDQDTNAKGENDAVKMTERSLGDEEQGIKQTNEQKQELGLTSESNSQPLKYETNGDLTEKEGSEEDNLVVLGGNGGETGSTEPTLDHMVEDAVEYYKAGSRNLSSWWSIVALWGAGENLADGTWILPTWNVTDPKLSPTNAGTEHIRYIFGLLAMGGDPSKAWETDRNLYAELAAQQDETTGAIGGINKHAWAMLALDAGEKLGRDVGEWNAETKQLAVDFLLEKQNVDNGFALFGTTSDTDITGMVLLALGNYQGQSAVDESIKQAKEFLKDRQLDLENGGFNSAGAWGSGDNSNSLSTSVSGLVAVGEDVLSTEWIVNGKTVVDAYKGFQLANGGFKWQHKDTSANGMATEQALVALTDIQTGKSIWQRIAEQAEPETEPETEPIEPEKSDLTAEVKESIQSVSALMLKNGVTSEWEAIGLARADVTVPSNYLSEFQKNLNEQVITKAGTGRLKVTDVERLTIAASAIGVNARDADEQGFSLIEKIHTSEHWTYENTDSIIYQGNNGIIFALIALDSKGYHVPVDAKWTREKLVAELLKTQKADGSWSLQNSTTATTSIDITAMALTALAPYTNESNAKSAVDKAVTFLSNAQGPTGGFNEAFVGGISSEATSQVIIGLTANKIDPRGEEFTKDGINLIDHLLSFKAEDGGFKHTSNEGTSNGMATEQALQGLVAFDLFIEDEGRLYEFGQEVVPEEPEQPAEPTLDHMVEDAVKYYKSGSRKLSSWWSIVALWGAGEDLADGTWELPAWNVTDPKLSPTDDGTYHINYIFGLLAMGGDPSKVWESDRNLYAELAAQQNKTTGGIGGINKHAWAMLALDAGEKLGRDVGGWNTETKQLAVNYLLKEQKGDGGFVLMGDTSDTDITGMVLLALGNYQDQKAVEASIEKAKEFLKKRQLDLENGGFNSTGKWGAGDNANSLSTSVSGLVAVGEDVLSTEWIVNGKTVVDAYKGFQLANGGFKWQHKDTSANGAATEQALVALTDIQTGKSIWQRIAEQTEPEQPEQPAIDKEALEVLIKSAEQQLSETQKGTEPGQYSQEVRKALEAKIANAQSIINSEDVSQEQVNAALNDLTQAIGVYNASVIPEKEQPVTPPAPVDKKITFSVEKRTMGQGDIISPKQATLQNGDTAFTLLKREVDNNNVSINYIGSGSTLYVQAIDNLGEFDGGRLSGWMYSVNGVFPDHSAGTYILNEGDNLRWQYTTNLGEDLGNTWDPGPIPTPDPTPDPKPEPKPEIPPVIEAPKYIETVIKDGKIQIQVKDKITGESKPAQIENSQSVGGFLIVQIGAQGEEIKGGVELPAGDTKVVVLDNDMPYEYFDVVSDIVPNKEWKVSFSGPLLNNPENLEKITVQNAAGEKVDMKVTFSDDNKTVIITPDAAYEQGELYYITILDAISATGQKQKKAIRKIFIVE